MSARLESRIKRIGCLAVAVLTLWLSGLGCALCCSTGVVEACCTSGERTYSRASTLQRDCCKQTRKSCAPVRRDSISQMPDGSCSLLPQQPPSLIRLPDATSFFAAVIPPAQFIPPPEMDVPAPLCASSVLLANRGSTYLRCCAFLI